jgi:hypothetical protein
MKASILAEKTPVTLGQRRVLPDRRRLPPSEDSFMYIRTLPLPLVCLLAIPACFTPNEDDELGGAASSSDGTPATEDDTGGDDASSATTTSATDDQGDADATDADTGGPEPTSGADETTTDAGDTDGTTTDAGDTEATTTDDDSTSETGMPVEDRIVFVTSEVHLGVIGQAADDVCQDAADAAGLPGTFSAWLSRGNASPSSTFQFSEGPYVRTDGAVLADNWDDVVDGELANAINRDENGDLAVGIAVWTNTAPDGTAIVGGANIGNCTAFTSFMNNQSAPIGRTTANSSEWTDYETQTCNGAAHFYCFQQ